MISLGLPTISLGVHWEFAMIFLWFRLYFPRISWGRKASDTWIAQETLMINKTRLCFLCVNLRIRQPYPSMNDNNEVWQLPFLHRAFCTRADADIYKITTALLDSILGFLVLFAIFVFLVLLGRLWLQGLEFHTMGLAYVLTKHSLDHAKWSDL